MSKPQPIGHFCLGSLSSLRQKFSCDAATTAGLVMFMLEAVSTLPFTRVLEMNGDPFPLPSAPPVTQYMHPAALMKLRRCLENK